MISVRAALGSGREGSAPPVEDVKEPRTQERGRQVPSGKAPVWDLIPGLARPRWEQPAEADSGFSYFRAGRARVGTAAVYLLFVF